MSDSKEPHGAIIESLFQSLVYNKEEAERVAKEQQHYDAEIKARTLQLLDLERRRNETLAAIDKLKA